VANISQSGKSEEGDRETEREPEDKVGEWVERRMELVFLFA
jgi:hypothetical protein